MIRFKKYFILIPAGLILLGGVGYHARRKFRRPRLETVYVTRLPAGDIFIFEDPQHPQLQKLREEEKIDAIVRPYQTDLEKILALAKWTSQLFPGTSPFPHYPPWNAREILRRIRSHETGGFCAQYTIIFGQACQSLGYQVRYVDLSSPRDHNGHFV